LHHKFSARFRRKPEPGFFFHRASSSQLSSVTVSVPATPSFDTAATLSPGEHL
jgi:hypothetical protein